MRLGHPSAPQWWDESFKSIAVKLPSGKVPLHNLSRILTCASRLNVAIPSALVEDLSAMLEGLGNQDHDNGLVKSILKVIKKKKNREVS